MAKRFGLTGPHERCLTCPEKDKCGFYLDLAANPGLKTVYLDNEKHDGYFRDRCVFRPDIDIEDTMNVVVRYSTGATLSYSLNAFNAWEGYHIAFNGTRGRLEHGILHHAARIITTCPAFARDLRERYPDRAADITGIAHASATALSGPPEMSTKRGGGFMVLAAGPVQGF